MNRTITDPAEMPLPMTFTFKGYRSDPILANAGQKAREDALAQAIRRWLRSRSRFGRLLNRLQRVRPIEGGPGEFKLRLVEEPKAN